MDSRSAFVDAGVSGLPPARVSPQVLTGCPRRVAERAPAGRPSAQGVRGAGAQWRATRPRGIWEVAGRGPSAWGASLASSSFLPKARGSPGSNPSRKPEPRSPLRASESRAPWAGAEPGAGTRGGRTGQRAESRRRPFARGPGARPAPPRPSSRPPAAASSSARTAPAAAGLRRHSPPRPVLARSREALLPAPFRRNAEPGKWGLTSKVFFCCFFIFILRLTLF